MPGLRLTLAQAARLWALDRDRVRSLLFALVDAGFLVRAGDGQYARRGDSVEGVVRNVRTRTKTVRAGRTG